MLENKGTGIVCFICGKNNHKAKYCPDKKLRGKYRRERLSKLLSKVSSDISNPSNIESNSISSIKIPKEVLNEIPKKTSKNPFEKAKGKIREIYDKICELSYFSNGLSNEIYKYVDSIYWLKHFSFLNSNNKNIYKNDYASKIIKEKINKVAYNYDKKNGLDSKEYKSFEEANTKVENFMEEIEKQQLKAKIDLIKEATKMQVKNELTSDLKITERVEKKGNYSNKKRVFLKQNRFGEWIEINQNQFMSEITSRVVNSLNNEFLDSINNKRKELGDQLIDNNLNLKKIEEKELREKSERKEKRRRIKEENMKNRLLESARIVEERKKREEFEERKLKEDEMNDLNVKFMNYLDTCKLVKKKYGIMGNPVTAKSFPQVLKEFKKSNNTILKFNDEEEVYSRLKHTYGVIYTTQLNNF